MLKRWRMDERLAQRPEQLLKGMVVRHASLLVRAC